MRNDPVKLEYRVILDWICRGSSVLDLGCYEGELSVSHQDIDDGLAEYGDQAFDYVILNQSLQQVRKPDGVSSFPEHLGLYGILWKEGLQDKKSRLSEK